MTLDIRGHLNVEKVRNNKDMPAEEGRGIGYYDDCMAKLANQEEDERLTETMDSLNLQKTRMLADTRHELKSVDKTLRKLQRQKKLLRRATLENVISRENKQVVYKSFKSISEEEEESDDTDIENSSKSDDSSTVNKDASATMTCPAFPGVPTPTDSSLASYDTYWLRRRGVNPPLMPRPASTKIFNEIENEKTNNGINKRKKFYRQKTMINLNNKINESDSSVKTKTEKVENKFRPKTSIGHNPSRRRSSLNSNRDRPHTAVEVGTRGRSRRELTQLTHIDAVMSSEREFRRNEWLENKSILKAEQDRVLRSKVQSFLETIERDKKKFLSDVKVSVKSRDLDVI
ncbi:uncharacterized protein [Antedon mediterranea]|uniref:uncharacterized protein n=1 Tax=Antedon mediterranea TaxID=105859 RepID=UPI003AF8562C